MVFKNPFFLILIPFTILIVSYFYRKQKKASFAYSSNSIVSSLSRTFKVRYSFTPYILRVMALVLFVIALAGPRTVLEETIYKSEGIDIVLAVDSSGSMAAEDFTLEGKRKNRLDVVKSVMEGFINERSSDRIGLIAFAGLAHTVCPLTTDYPWIIANLERVTLGLIEDGTAVGSAIASSMLRLKTSKAESKVVILLTDGVNNAGNIDPISAAKAAKTYGIKIYTIGAGSKGLVPFPAQNFFGQKAYRKVEIGMDEEMLKEVASITGGQYYRATDTESLKKIYQEIDRLEKTEIEEIGYYEYNELFDKFLIAALILLFIELILSQTLFLKVP